MPLIIDAMTTAEDVAAAAALVALPQPAAATAREFLAAPDDVQRCPGGIGAHAMPLGYVCRCG